MHVIANIYLFLRGLISPTSQPAGFCGEIGCCGRVSRVVAKAIVMKALLEILQRNWVGMKGPPPIQDDKLNGTSATSLSLSSSLFPSSNHFGLFYCPVLWQCVSYEKKKQQSIVENMVWGYKQHEGFMYENLKALFPCGLWNIYTTSLRARQRHHFTRNASMIWWTARMKKNLFETLPHPQKIYHEIMLKHKHQNSCNRARIESKLTRPTRFFQFFSLE